MNLNDSFPKLAALSGANIETAPEAAIRIAGDWAKHDTIILYPGANAVQPSIYQALRSHNPDLRIGLYHNFLRVLDTDVRTYWPGMPLCSELELLVGSEHWPGWSKVDHDHDDSRMDMTSYHRDERARLKPDFMLADECHADLSFMAEVEISPANQYAAMTEVLRKSGGACINGNFGMVTPNFPDGTYTSMIRGRFLQHAEDLTGPALFDMAKFLITESSLTQPKERDYIIDGGGIKSVVLACLCDGGSGGMWPDYRQSLATLPIARGVLGRVRGYADGSAQKPVDTVKDFSGLRLEREFERGFVWLTNGGDCGVEVR